MPLFRPSAATTRVLIAVLAASALLFPASAGAALANHDLQRITLHHCDDLRHDRAIGPASAGLADPGLN